MNVISSTAAYETSATDLTASQFRIWTGQMLNPDKPLYNMAMAFQIKGSIVASTFSTAFQKIIDENDALRTIFREHNGFPSQHVVDELRFDIEFIDLSDSTSPAESGDRLLKERAKQQFTLTERLFDSALLKLGRDCYVWFINQHHLICDAWSCGVLHQRLAHFYQAALDGQLDEVTPPPQFLEYRLIEHDTRTSSEGLDAARYWAKKFEPGRSALELYGRRVDPRSTATCRISCAIGQERSEKLRALSNDPPIRSISQDLSLYYIFSALLFVYIHRVSGQHDLVIGSPCHNRSTPAQKQTLGLFVELFPLQLTIAPEDTFRTLIESLKPQANDLLRHALPGASSEVPGDCFSAVLNYINVSFTDFCGMSSHCSWIHSDYGDQGHAIRLQVHDFSSTGSFTLLFDLNEEIFPLSISDHAAAHFLNLMDALLADLDTRIDKVPLLSVEETELLVTTYNDTATVLPPKSTILELVKEQVERAPEAIAIIENDLELSYRQLDHISETIALGLKQMGIGSEDVVAVYMDRSASLIVSLIAIMKAGAAFVPIDSTFPEQRFEYVLEDSGCPLVLTSGNLRTALPGTRAKVVDYEEISSASTAERSKQPHLEAIEPHSIAYMIYTSGSTGRPKGVMVEHHSLLNYLCWARKEYMADGPHDFPLFSSVAADLTITSIFLPLISGSTVVVYPESREGIDLSIMEVFSDDRVDIIKLTPSHLALLDGATAPPARLKKLIVGGEDFKASLARRISSLYVDNIIIYNEYGPTEATVGCMIYRFDPEQDSQASVAIGRPIDNLRIYLLDAALNPVPVGVKGDLYISGSGLARGYRNQAGMTAEKFVQDPYHPGERMYCSGDIGRWRCAGVMDYLGRDDDQVKVRGFRIERGEIEAVLCEIDGINESFCQVVEQSGSIAGETLARCRTCGLPANVPKADLDENEICAHCRNFEEQRHLAEQYFKSEEDLHLIIEQAKKGSRGRYDCLMQYSGGKDSTFALYKLVEMGMHPLVFSFDNGFISESAKDNVRRIADDLELDLHWGKTPAMNEIFVDSLRRFSNVCNGCQKVINTMSVSLANEHGINFIFTGLSRGQSFETRVADLLNIGVVDIGEIDKAVVEARKAYHQMDDAVNRLLDVSIFGDETVFERIQFIDFYRYYDVPLAEVLNFLTTRTPWTRPSDTGRSTNCLINEAGIYIHKKERGYHNYAAPYSWDVRLGHKQRGSALKELEDDIDEARVHRMLKEIGYDPDEKALSTLDRRIVAYYVGEREFTPEELRKALARTIPAYMIPAFFLRMPSFPLNSTGKVDHRALPLPTANNQTRVTGYKGPRNGVEKMLTEIWQHVLGIERIGIHDNFFDLGGDSILNIQIVSRAVKAGIHITPALLFQNQTIAELADAASRQEKSAFLSRYPDDGHPVLTPIQHWYFNLNLNNPNCWNMCMRLNLVEDVVPEILEKALQHLIDHHQSLRMRFMKTTTGWEPVVIGKDDSFILEHHTLNDETEPTPRKFIDEIVQSGNESLDIQNGPLLKALLFEWSDKGAATLVIIIHHLIVDGISWYILLDDIHTAYQRLLANDPPDLPSEITPITKWSRKILAYANSAQAEKESVYWKSLAGTTALQIPRDRDWPDNGLQSSAEKVELRLNRDETRILLHQMPRKEQVSVEEVLLSCVVKALHEWTGSSFIRIDMEGHGREELLKNVNLLRTTGWFTSLFPVNIIVPAGGDVEQFLQAVKQQVRSIPNRGFSFGPLLYLNENPLINEDLTAHPKSDILFNYFGDLSQLLGQSSLFSPDSPIELYRGPDEKRCYLLELTSFVYNDQLEIHWTYSRDCHNKDTIATLTDYFLNNINRLIKSQTTSPAETFSSTAGTSHIVDKPSRIKQNEHKPYPLSPLQSGILFHSLKEPGSGVYIEQLCCTIVGDFDTELFQQAWKQLLSHHAILRSSLIWEQSEEPVQLISDAVVLHWHCEDLSGKSLEEITARLEEFLYDERQQGFSLADAPLMRCALFNLDTTSYRWIWSFHHIICDGWSTSQILEEVFDLYDSLQGGTTKSFPSQRPFSDYVLWLEEQDQSAAKRYWQNHLQGFNNPTPLSIQSFNAKRSGYCKQELLLSEELTRSLITVARGKRLTLNTVLQGAWSILLHRYSGDEDIMFGTTVSGRPHALEGVETMIGLFINTLPFRIHIEPKKSFAEWLAYIMEMQVEARDYEYSSLVKIHEWSDFQPGVPLFDSILVFENYPAKPKINDSRRNYSIKDIEYLEQSNYPLSIITVPGERLRLISVYDKRLFSDSSMVRLLEHLQTIVEEFTRDPDQIIDDVSLIPQDELLKIEKWQDSSNPVPDVGSVLQMFGNAVVSNPDKSAVVCLSQKLSYQDLNSRANRLARYLLEHALSPGSFHGIYIDRSVDMVIAILAVLKSGSAYIPLDPAYPAGRIEHMLSDSQPAAILTLNHLAGSLPESDAVIISLDDEDLGLESFIDTNPDLLPDPDSIAYTIYTSGSTGVPKGVMVTHESLSYATTARIHYYAKRPERFLLLSSISFDSSVAGIFGTLCRGGCLYIPDQKNYKDVGYLADLITKNSISHILAIPSLYKHLLNFHSAEIGSLQTVIVAGETCSNDIIKKHWSSCPHTELFNEYGPTEATVWSTAFDCSSTFHSSSVPIGRPVGNVRAYVFDEKLRHVPVGVPGELYLGGATISPGYLNQPALTAERFIPFPNKDEEQTIYKTGDLVRFLDDGSLEFLGRNDEQIKLRGYRIELSEIESAIMSCESVAQAAVVARRTNVESPRRTTPVSEEKIPSIEGIAAFIVLHHDEEFNKEKIRALLGMILPEYMIPSDFILVDALPLMPNGKIDRQRLPDPNSYEAQDSERVLLPRTRFEEEIATIWREVLDRDQINMNDNFFEVGGHSLLAVTLFGRIKKKTGLDLPLATLFSNPTLLHLIEALNGELHGGTDDRALRDNNDKTAKHSARSNWEVMVPIRQDGDKPPLFLFHAIGGNVLNYSALLPYLDKSQPVYGLQARGLDGLSDPFKDLHQMVEEYAEQIQEINPHGPYFLAGGSMGGLIAIELARLLQSSGKSILFLGMFDTLGPDNIIQSENLPSSSSRDFLPDPGILSRINDRWPNTRIVSIFSHLVNLSMYHWFKLIKRPRPEDLRQWLLVYSNLKIINGYEPEPYNGGITLFKSSYSNTEESFYGWQNIAQRGVEIIEIPAHHGSFVESPELGKELNVYLKRLCLNL